MCSWRGGVLVVVIAWAFAAPVRAQTVVLAGGGPEGNIGDTSAWSYKLYKALVENGDVDGDGVVRVAILSMDLSATADVQFLPRYFQWIGRTMDVTVEASNVEVSSRRTASTPAVVDPVGEADAVFVKKGDQGNYYDAWNETLLEQRIRAVAGRAGAIGGTGAGAMSLAGFCLCGGRDLTSSDPMRDAHTEYLNDASQPGTSGIHTDFLSLIPGVFIDTHFTERARLGRLLGVLAKAADDSERSDLLGIGLGAATGVVIRDGRAEVLGKQAISFVHETSSTERGRFEGRPLVYTHLRLDRLTEGWGYDIDAQAPMLAQAPAAAHSVAAFEGGTTNAGALSVDGDRPADTVKFEWVASYRGGSYALASTEAVPFIHDAVGFADVMRRDGHQGDRQAALFRALFDVPHSSGFLLFSPSDDPQLQGSQLTRMAGVPDQLRFEGDMAAIVIDGSRISYRGLAPQSGGARVRAAALINARVHVLAGWSHRVYNSKTRRVGLPQRPVRLVAFEASVESGNVVLRWITARSVDVNFVVQHRVGTAPWEQLGIIGEDETTVLPQTYSVTIKGLVPGRHRFRLKYLFPDGTIAYSAPLEIQMSQRGLFTLTAPHPNPFRGTVTFALSVAHAQRVRILLYDVQGRRVKTIYDGMLSTNEVHPFRLEAGALASGVYLLRVSGDEFTTDRTIVHVE